MSNPTYAEARKIIFRIGAQTDNYDVHSQLDELLGMMGYWEETARQRQVAHIASHERVRELEAKVDQLESELLQTEGGFDSVLASNMLARMAEQNGRLDHLVSAVARLGAVVEGDD